MSIKITPIPIDQALERALGLSPGVSMTAKFLHVGKGLQTIAMDDAGRATTRTLKSPVGYIEILFAKKVNPYQWQMVVDVKNAHTGTDFPFSEFTVCDDQKRPIAIYGNATQALYAVTDVLDNALIAINLVMGAFPADSIVVEHHNLPLNMFFDQEFREIHLALTSNTTDILRHDREIKTKASAAEFGIVGASKALTDAQYMQERQQAGVLTCRHYSIDVDNTDSLERGVYNVGYADGNRHTHANYDRMAGQAELSFVTPQGLYARVRHSDYRFKQAIQGAFGATEDVPLPVVPASVLNSGTVDQQAEAMRNLYRQYQAGSLPDGFFWVMTIIETHTEYFTGSSAETFDSFRHQNLVDDAVSEYRLNKVFADTGFKDRFENLPINQVFVAGLRSDGSPILGIQKARYICRKVEGDIRSMIDQVDDPVMDFRPTLEPVRYRFRDVANGPGFADTIMRQIPGLNGAGAYLEERHERSGVVERVMDWNTRTVQNAAYYNRFGASLDDDASGLRNYKAGYNATNYWKALTTHPNVMASEYGAHSYRVSTAMIYEATLFHPAMAWRPVSVAVTDAERNGHLSNRGTLDNPYLGINQSGVWYHTPNAFYQPSSGGTTADTGAGVKYVKATDGSVHAMRASGIYTQLPEIAGVGVIQQRIPLYHRPQDATYETALAHAYHRRNLFMTDKLSAEITRLMASQIQHMGAL